MNLDDYCLRIEYAGKREPTLEVLKEIVLAHSCSIPFENLDVQLNRRISLDDESVDRKLIHDRRGGYCFEQNFLLERALTAIGFVVTPLSARVRLNFTRDVVPPRTHLFLRVDLDGVPWLADVGVGGYSPTGPIRLDLFDIEQRIPHEPRRIVCEHRQPFPRYFHQALADETWIDVYEFTREEMPPIDRELGNWWTSANPNSRFRTNLIVSLARRDGTRLSILNREFTHRRGPEILEQYEIADADQLLTVLHDRFGLHFPTGTRFELPTALWPTGVAADAENS